MDISEALKVIKNADLSADTKANKIANNLRDIIVRKTNNYANPDAISTEPVDVSAIVIKKGFSLDDYKKEIGDPKKRSEADVVISLAKRISGNGKSSSESESELTESELLIMMQMYEYELELLEI